MSLGLDCGNGFRFDRDKRHKRPLFRSKGLMLLIRQYYLLIQKKYPELLFTIPGRKY